MGGETNVAEGLRSRCVIGAEDTLAFHVTETKTVPYLYPESPEFQAFPNVFATGFIVGLLEWACMRALGGCHPGDPEMTVGAHIDVAHLAPAIPGQEVRAWARLVSVEPPRLLFKVRAYEGNRLLAEGTHVRWLVSRADFEIQARSLAGGISQRSTDIGGCRP